MGWGIGEFSGNFMAHRARTKRRGLGIPTDDRDIAAYNAVNEGLKNDCLSIVDDQITEKAKKLLCKALKQGDPFEANLAIDGNPGFRKRPVCIALLKLTVTYLFSENLNDMVRSAKYNLLGCPK